MLKTGDTFLDRNHRVRFRYFRLDRSQQLWAVGVFFPDESSAEWSTTWAGERWRQPPGPY